MKNTVLPIIVSAFFGLLAVSASIFLSNESMMMIAVSLAAAIAISVCIARPVAGLCALALLYPFTYWQVVYGSINVPYGDLLALILFTAWGLGRGWRFLNGERFSQKEFPVLVPMLLFAASAALSLINVPYEAFNEAVKYIARPIIFFYLMFIVLPCALITTRKTLLIVLRALFATGLFVAAMGVWSLLFPETKGLRRAVPVGVFGTYPLGTNHNQLAEILVALAPIAFIFYAFAKTHTEKVLYFFAACFMIGIALLTLSRAGWIALAVEGVAFAWLYREQTKKLLKGYGVAIIIAALAPFAVIMYYLVTSYTSVAATSTRLKLIDIAISMFNEAPLIGKGVSTFITTVYNTRWFMIEYGTVLDAHGFIFKVLAEQGILGIATFLILLVSIFSILYRAISALRVTQPQAALVVTLLSLGALGAVVFQAAGTAYYVSKMWLPIGIALSSVAVFRQGKS